MNILGYLVTMVNLQSMSRIGPPLKDVSLHLDTIDELKKELVSLPDFPLEGYRNGLQRHGNLAVYPSKAVRDYIFDGKGYPHDESIIIKLHYDGNTNINHKYDTLSYFIHKDEVDSTVHEEVNKYLMDVVARATRRERRNKRSLLDKLIPQLNIYD